MTLSRRVWIPLAAVVVALAVGAGGQAVWARAEKGPKVHGTNFSLHTYTDPNFCMESEGDTRVIISQCADRDNQHFTFTDNPDGTSAVVDGYGDCLDRGDGLPQTPLTAQQCTFGPTQRFIYSPTGKLQQPPHGTTCVAAAAATQNAPVFDDHCKAGPYVNVFQLSH